MKIMKIKIIYLLFVRLKIICSYLFIDKYGQRHY